MTRERQEKLFTWRAENLITRAELIEYGQSKDIREVKDLVDELVTGEKPLIC